MFAIDTLIKDATNSEQVRQAVTSIEALIQPHDAWTYQTFTDMLLQSNTHMLIIYKQQQTKDADDKTVVGYCLYQVVFEQAEILRIGTHPDYQRQGLASLLFERLYDELKNSGAAHLLLEVRADNIAAIGLYERQRFVVIHTRQGYYHSPHQPAVDALVMQRIYE